MIIFSRTLKKDFAILAVMQHGNLVATLVLALSVDEAVVACS